MANDYLQVFNTDCRNQTRYVTATPSPSQDKTALDVNVCNPNDIEPCIQTITNTNLSVSQTESSVALVRATKTYIKITNMSEFYPVFVSQASGGQGDVVLPCSVNTICMNTTANNNLFFTTESGDARVIVSQGES